MGVSVVVPSYNCKEILFRLLDSLEKSDYPSLEVLVVDNGSKDGTLGEGKNKYKSVKWIDAGEKNIGQTGCYNLGFAKADSRNHLTMIDSDVVVTPSMISELVKRLESAENIGIVTPMVLTLKNKNWVNQAGAYVNLWFGNVTVGWGPKEKFLEAKDVQNSGTVMMFKRELVNKIGGFENWFMCYFDPDYCLRAKKIGYSTWYEPSATCYHDQPTDPNLYEPRVMGRAYLLGRNRTLFMRKHGKFLVAYIVSLPIFFAYYLRTGIKYKILPKWFDYIRGTWDGFFQPVRKNLKVPLPKV